MAVPTRLADWEQSLRNIGQSLLTVEVNTVEKLSMSAQKMPEAPLALHAIIETYRQYLADQGYPIDTALLADASERIALLEAVPSTPDAVAADKVLVGRLSAWHPTLNAAQAELANGPETFEALQWAAWAALRDIKTIRDHALTPTGESVFDPETGGVLARIRANSRQLREAAILLRDGHRPLPGSNKLPMFGVTLEAATRALMNDPVPPLTVPIDVLVLVRKAWDIGTETVMMQTSMQIDGDLVLRISPGLTEAKRAFFADLHSGSVATGIRQWNSLFVLVRDLLEGLGKKIFGTP